MIEFRKVSKSFVAGGNRKVVLDRASLRVRRGQRLGILSDGNSGKTTLINMICGTEPLDSGRIIRRGRVSFPLGTLPGLSPNLNAVDNTGYLARLYGQDPTHSEVLCRYLAGIGDAFDQPLSTYSSRMRMRYCWSAMLALRFDVYLVDDSLPHAGNNDFLRRALPVLAHRLSQATLILVTSKPAVLQQHCRSAVMLQDGRFAPCDTFRQPRKSAENAA